MLSPSPGHVRSSARWSILILLGAFGLAAEPARAEDFPAAMDRFADLIKRALDGERETEVALNQFNAPARLDARSSSGIRKALEEGLKKRKIRVERDARLEITGEYREVEEPNGKAVVRIKGRVVDQQTGAAVTDCEVKIDNLTSIAVLVGATMELPPTPVAAARENAIREGISRPSASVANTRISADPKSLFGIEILVGPSGCPDRDLRPRAAAVDRGQAYMNIRTSERYAVRLINEAPYDVAVTLSIDGLNLFTFSDNKNYTYVIVPKRSIGQIPGWFRTHEEAEQFVVTEYAKSAAAATSVTPPADLGVITACFAAAWPVDGRPPHDEADGRSVSATGRGPSTKTDFREVERKTGRLRASVSVRYTKEEDPKDLPAR